MKKPASAKSRPTQKTLLIPPERSAGGSVEILYGDPFVNARNRLSFFPSPAPLKLEGWNLARTIPTWTAPKLPARLVIFCLELGKIKFKVLS